MRACTSATTSVNALPWPVGVQPAGDCGGEWIVEAGPVCPHPGLDRPVLLLGARRVQVHAADDVAVDRIEDGEGEPGAGREVTGMAAQIGQVLSERHAPGWRPVAVGVSGRGADVLDARRPRSVVRLVVLWSEWFETKLVSDDGRRGNEPWWDERARGHDEDGTRAASPV